MRYGLLALCLLAAPSFAPAREPDRRERPDWAQAFAGEGVSGTMLVLDERADRWLVFDRARVERRFSRASTFTVLNAPIALAAGAVEDEYETIRWDGTKRAFDDWNRDQSLASAMKFSALWFYREMARRVGAKRMQERIDAVGCGNRDISAVEQVDFLRRLAHGTLPSSPRAQEAVRRITIVDAAPDHLLQANTGWAVHGGSDGEADLGWVVGWVERDGRHWFFALNIDMPHGAGDAAKRVPLAQALLADAGALSR